MQEPTPPYEDILEDETLAPLKRNHACLQCKKRKVKCDAVRPTCNPCMRSHAHALRSAQRNKSRPPPLVCSYAEGDEDDMLDDATTASFVVDAERKRSSAAAAAGGASGAKRAAVGDKMIRERDRRAVEEKDTLKARIAELEARIATLTTADPLDSASQPSADPIFVSNNNNNAAPPLGNNWSMPMETFPIPAPQTHTAPSIAAPFLSIETGAPGNFQSFDFSNLLMVPNHWPKNLPSPAVLEHLIETFFQCEPQINRILHQGTLLGRLRLPPTSDNFPFAGLLHAICAAAAPHSAWNQGRSGAEVDEIRNRNIKSGIDLEMSEDFATSQAEAAERCIRHSTMVCMMGGSGQFVFDIARAQLILTNCYLNHSMALRAWMVWGSPTRLIRLLEITNRNKRKSDKPPMLQDPETDVEREERLGTVWFAHLVDSIFAACSAAAPSFDADDIQVPLPASKAEFGQKFDYSGYIKPNPQTAHDPDLLVHHPVPDNFVFVVKSSILLGRVAKWIRTWQQRVITPGDEMKGFQSPSFVQLNGQILSFQMSLPTALKNIYRLGDGSFDADLIAIHLYPNLALLLLHEQFVDWKGPESPSLRQMISAFEAVVTFVQLVPSQLDATHIMNPLTAFSLFSVGKLIARFIIRANEQENYAQAMRWKTDAAAITNLLQRYGIKHPLGANLVEFLIHFQKMFESGALQLEWSDCCPSTPPKASVTEACVFGGAASSSRSSAPSVNGGTASASPAVPSMGQTPESIETLDSSQLSGGGPSSSSQAQNGAPFQGIGMNGGGSMNGLDGFGLAKGGDATLPVFGASPMAMDASGPLDPSILDFLDPIAAGQLSAALDGASNDPDYINNLFAGFTADQSAMWATSPNGGSFTG